MLNVLRMQEGQEVIIIDSIGKAAKAEIIAINAQTVNLKLISYLEEAQEPNIKLNLIQGLTKGEKMDYIVQKAVELGIYSVIPFEATRSVVKYDRQKKEQRVTRWQKIAYEASKQCRRNIIPQIKPINSLKEIINEIPSTAAVLVLYEGETMLGLKNILQSTQQDNIYIIVGPEGGFTKEEIELCLVKDAKTVTIGPRILRTETAAIAAITAVMYECADLGG